MEPIKEQLQILFRRMSLLNASCCDECCGEQISVTQCVILREVRRRPDSSMQHIAEELGVDITTFSRQIKRMETKGLFIRRISPADHRVNLLILCPAGVEALLKIDDYISTQFVEIFERMSRFELETVARSLTLLNDAMQVIAESERNQDERLAFYK